MPKKKPRRDRPLSIERAKKRIAKALNDVAAGNDPGVQSFRIKPVRKAGETYPLRLTQLQRESIIECSRLTKNLVGRINALAHGTQVLEVTRKELDHLNDEIGRAADDARSPHKQRLVAVLRQLAELFAPDRVGLLGLATPNTPPKSALIYQFKITLLEVKPSIWRRVQVQDCTLDKLHEHIQTAMGWTNSHLHQFEINGERCGDPDLLEDDIDPFQGVDSTKTLLSRIFPKNGERFAFKYDYDFGDYWEHEVLFEGHPPIVLKAKYPLCLEGERACPPEDCGGTSGYGDFLEVIRNPKHEEQESMLEWIGGRFDPEKFNPKQATKAMSKGLPDWRTMRYPCPKKNLLRM